MRDRLEKLERESHRVVNFANALRGSDKRTPERPINRFGGLVLYRAALSGEEAVKIGTALIAAAIAGVVPPALGQTHNNGQALADCV
jgi:hypothetical protein